mmetsp:Transcript_31167/g.57805  ORF Transcript_31167/g.57805 Transcript_31167/m.57805 type:complete len:307 (+) Transcript_31167:1287-2207(+)
MAGRHPGHGRGALRRGGSAARGGPRGAGGGPHRHPRLLLPLQRRGGIRFGELFQAVLRHHFRRQVQGGVRGIWGRGGDAVAAHHGAHRAPPPHHHGRGPLRPQRHRPHLRNHLLHSLPGAAQTVLPVGLRIGPALHPRNAPRTPRQARGQQIATLSVPRQRHPATHPGGHALVRRPGQPHTLRRPPLLRKHLHRALLHPDVVVELQVLPRLRLPVGRLRDPVLGGVHDHHHRGVLLPQLGELPVAVDGVLLGREHGVVRLPLQHLLLCVQDEHARVGADVVLLRVHDVDQFGHGYALRNAGSLGCQ